MSGESFNLRNLVANEALVVLEKKVLVYPDPCPSMGCAE